MSKTRAELINQALVNLSIFVYGQTLESENVQKMDTIVGPALDELADLDIYYVSDQGSIGPTGGAFENSAFLSLAAYIANAACAAFNLPADQKMITLSQIAEGKLITLTRPARTLRTLRVDPALQTRRIGIYRGGI